MSEYHEVKTEYKDGDALVQALGEMGYTTVEVHETPQPLVDYRGNQTHYVDKTGDKANIIVRRKFVGGAANDLGFIKKPDGSFGAMISQYDSSKHNAGWLKNLKKNYTEKVVIKTAAKSGFKYLGKKIVNNKAQLQWLDTRA
jgi:hypothetical protein